ncbi:hypothetical protein AYI70_g1048 [Smittium culicis]|uniref:Uncharacterized protein n=1 Tax=Smittium culicis TaxID=133412 RepID=A0A1R1YEB0_9FUNG|nr:hypothetical protein AYI70_g1048 [Smittium culicis]
MSNSPFIRIKIPTTGQEGWSTKSSSRRRLSPKYIRSLVLLVFAVSIAFNLYFFFRPKPLSLSKLLSDEFKGKEDGVKAKEFKQIKKVDYKDLTDLIIVPGHAVFTGEGSALDEKNWELESYQSGNVGVFVSHIHKGIEILQEHEKALLIFSG